MTNSKTLIISLITFTLVSYTFLKNSFAENETSNFSSYDFIGKVKVVDGDTIKSGKIKINPIDINKTGVCLPLVSCNFFA